MANEKVTCYGIDNSQAVRALSLDQNGFLGVNLNLAGTSIFSLNPFSAQFDVDAAILDMMPTVNFTYLAGPNTGSDNSTVFYRPKIAFSGSVVDPAAAQVTAELSGAMQTDAPAAHTAASLNVASDNATNVLVKGFGYTVSAVAAIAAPVTIEVRTDTGGANTLVYSAKVLLPVGTSREVWIPCNFLAPVDVEITATDPGATNFVSVMLETNTALDGAPS